MEKIKKRADGRYQANICISQDPETGVRKYKTIYAKTIRDLEQKKNLISADLQRGTYSDDAGYTLEKYAYVWLDTYKKGVAPATYNGYKNIIKNHLYSAAQIRLMDLKKSDLQNSLNKIRGYDLKRRFKLTINQILECAIEDGLIYKNVSHKLELPTMQRLEKRALTDTEKKSILNAELTNKQRLFVLLLQYTGARRGEILALTRSDINLSDGTIQINKSLAHENNSAYVKSPKTKSSYRSIDILSPLEPTLKKYLKETDSFILFTDSKGSYMTKMSYRRFWESIYVKLNRAAGGKHHYEKSKVIFDIDVIHGLTPHIFRHNYATMLYYAGVDIKDAVRLLGHADSKVTIDIYTHLDKAKSGSKNKLENFFLSELID